MTVICCSDKIAVTVVIMLAKTLLGSAGKYRSLTECGRQRGKIAERIVSPARQGRLQKRS